MGKVQQHPLLTALGQRQPTPQRKTHPLKDTVHVKTPVTSTVHWHPLPTMQWGDKNDCLTKNTTVCVQEKYTAGISGLLRHRISF